MKTVFFQVAWFCALVSGVSGCSRYSSVSKNDPELLQPIFRGSSVSTEQKVSAAGTIWGRWATVEGSARPAYLELREQHGKFEPLFRLDRVEADTNGFCRIQESTDLFEIAEMPEGAGYEIRVKDLLFTALPMANAAGAESRCTALAEQRMADRKEGLPLVFRMTPSKESGSWVFEEVSMGDDAPSEKQILQSVSEPPIR